ncbi:MAG: MFS transporter, partial [Plesiomonas sp.]
QFGIAPALSLQANSIAIIMLFTGCILSGSAADRFGASKTLVAGSLLLAGCTWLFYQSVGTHPEMLFLTYALAGFSVGVVGVVPYVMVRAFPAEVRFSGISFSYNVAYAIFGGLTPIFITLIMKLTPLAPAYYVLALSVIGLLLGLYLHRDLNAEKKTTA